MLVQQVPGLENFLGEDVTSGGESIQDWLEQLELLAEAFEWDEWNKLIHLMDMMAKAE